MTMPTIKRYRIWYACDLRKCLDEHGLYTNGTDEDFEKLHDFIDDHYHEPEIEVMYEAAMNILERSDGDTDVISIMHHLEQDTISAGYYIP